MENWNNFNAQSESENKHTWHQAATDGQWISIASEDAMHFKSDDDDEATVEEWGDVDPQPSTGPNEPSAPGSAV